MRWSGAGAKTPDPVEGQPTEENRDALKRVQARRLALPDRTRVRGAAVLARE